MQITEKSKMASIGWDAMISDKIFERIFPIRKELHYNSYFIDEKTCVIDAMDKKVAVMNSWKMLNICFMAANSIILSPAAHGTGSCQLGSSTAGKYPDAKRCRASPRRSNCLKKFFHYTMPGWLCGCQGRRSAGSRQTYLAVRQSSDGSLAGSHHEL